MKVVSKKITGANAPVFFFLVVIYSNVITDVKQF